MSRIVTPETGNTPLRFVDNTGRRVRLVGRDIDTGAPTVNPTSPDQSGTMPPVYWSADFPTSRFSRYLSVYPYKYDDTKYGTGVVEGADYGIAPDPDGSGRQVAWMDNSRGLTHGNSNPRVDAEATRIIKPAAHGNPYGDYWFGHSFRIDGSWSDYAKDSVWLSTITGGFGPPYTTSSPLGFGVWPVGQHGKVRLVLGDAGDLILPYEYQISTDQWYTIVLNYTFHYADMGGRVRGWIAPNMNGDNAQPLPIKGHTTDYCSVDTMGRGINDAWYVDPTNPENVPNSSRAGCYSAPGTRAKVWYGHHKIAGDVVGANWFDLVRQP